MVHHFVVYGSIEEQIHYKYSQDQDKDWTVQSIVHLLGLFGFFFFLLHAAR